MTLAKFMMLLPSMSSFRRRPESSGFKYKGILNDWIPAFAGMTESLSVVIIRV
jgi:hypothetical protein